MSIPVALIGASSMSHYHADGILAVPGLELAGFCDVSADARRKAREKYNVRTWETIADCLAASDVEVVVVILPNEMHLPVTLQALEAGKHVVVEKPMAITDAQCQEMIAAARQADRLLTVHQNRRWDNDYLAIKQAIEQGRVGRVREIETATEGHWLPGGWRREKARGGGVLYDWGAHKIDQMLRMRPDARPVQVFGEMYVDPATGMDIELAGFIFVRMDDGSNVTYRFSHVTHHSPRPSWYVSGLEGTLVLPDANQPVSLYRSVEKGMETCSFPSQVIEPEPVNWGRFYLNLAEAIAGNADLAVKPEESAMVVKIIEAALLSAQEKRLIDV